MMQTIGRYEILAELGRGAMGIVYSATDPLIGRRVAIKTIRLDSADAAENRQELTRRLFREAQSAGVLSHPGIVTIHDVGEQGNEAYIVMEYVDGRNLEDVLASGVPQHSGTLLSILRQSASALDYAHSHGIVHRDIKPSNIMICNDGVVKIADFGVAKLAASTSMTQAGLVLGTPSYMSPEQAQGHALDGHSDQFSLAVIAYRMLTGDLPFAGTTLTAILTRLLLEEPQYDSSGLHPYLQIVFKRALAKIPQLRFPNCTDFARDLENAYALCKSEMAGSRPALTGRDPKPEGTSDAVPPAVTRVESTPLPAPIGASETTDAAAKEDGSEPAPPDVSAPEKPAPAEAMPPSPAPEHRVQAPKRKSGRTAWVASFALIALAIVVFFAIGTIQKQKTPDDGVSLSDDRPGAGQTQSKTPGTGENKPAVEIDSQSKPAAIQAAASEPSPPQTVEVPPGAESEPRPARRASIAPTIQSGVITWSGQLEKNAVLVIAPPQVSVGTITGKLPGKPVAIEVEPGDMIIRHMPDASNGYNHLMLYSGSNRFTAITIRWKTLK